MEKIKREIKHLKYSREDGVHEYKINNPKKNNGCVLSFIPISALKELRDLIDTEIIRKQNIKVLQPKE